jgi:hypothetical protein
MISYAPIGMNRNSTTSQRDRMNPFCCLHTDRPGQTFADQELLLIFTESRVIFMHFPILSPLAEESMFSAILYFHGAVHFGMLPQMDLTQMPSCMAN